MQKSLTISPPPGSQAHVSCMLSMYGSDQALSQDTLTLASPSHSVLYLMVPIHFLTQSYDPVSCYGKTVEWTIEIISRLISLIRCTGFPWQLIGSHDGVRKWIFDGNLAGAILTHLSDPRHCQTVKSKFAPIVIDRIRHCPTTVPDSGYGPLQCSA